MSNHLSRRKFMYQAACAGVGYSTLYSTLVNLKSLNAASILNNLYAPPDDYKALVCIFLTGGADTYNMLIPRGTAEWNEYQVTRSNLAIPNSQILPITPLNPMQKTLGVHPNMPHIQSLFEAEKLAFICNAGSMVNGITKQSYFNGTAQLPLGLYSHADQIMHWQTAVPHDRVAQGWGGKLADIFTAANVNAGDTISMNISLSGTNVFQTGNETIEYTVDPNYGSPMIIGYNDGDWQTANMRTQAIDNLLDQYHVDAFKKTYIDIIKKAKQGAEVFNEAIEDVTLTTIFSGSRLSQSLQMVARTIAARQTLGMSRQIFFIEYGGWDHHDELLANQAVMLSVVDDACNEFMNSMEELNISDKVTTFMMTEFGRTLTSNGNGTDHAWGGNVFVMGGAVHGRRVYGEYPSLALGNPIELGSGTLIPQISVDEYYAELALWFGVAPSDLVTLFPNIGNFYNVSGGVAPIGFLL